MIINYIRNSFLTVLINEYYLAYLYNHDCDGLEDVLYVNAYIFVMGLSSYIFQNHKQITIQIDNMLLKQLKIL